MASSSPLARFKAAQDTSYDGYPSALRELKAGRKKGHWIWYVFPQIDGLGMSDTAQVYAIHGKDEAVRFLNDVELRSRLLTAVTVVAEQLRSGTTTLRTLMASDIDAKKFVSSLTLFGAVATELRETDDTKEIAELAAAADDVLAITTAEGYPPCAYTLQRLRSG